MKNKDEENRRPRCLPFIKLLLNAAFLRTHNWIGKTAKIMLRPSCTRPRARLFYVEDLPQTPASCTPWNGHRVIRLFIRQCRIDRLLQGMHIGYYWLINTVIICLSLSPPLYVSVCSWKRTLKTILQRPWKSHGPPSSCRHRSPLMKIFRYFEQDWRDPRFKACHCTPLLREACK